MIQNVYIYLYNHVIFIVIEMEKRRIEVGKEIVDLQEEIKKYLCVALSLKINV